MPWRKMRLRGDEVFARCDDDGALRQEGGRVEIRYRREGSKAYRAAARNLAEAGPEVFPDEHCGEAGDAPAAKKRSGGGRAVSAKATSHPTSPVSGEVLAYADGACSGNPGPAGLGVVLMWDDQRRELSEFLGHGTNNIAELTAILRVAEAVPDKARPVHIHTDSSYAIGLLTKGWKPKKNQELVARVRAAIDGLEDVKLFHVRGHAGIALNERADALARRAVDFGRTSGWVTPS